MSPRSNRRLLSSLAVMALLLVLLALVATTAVHAQEEPEMHTAVMDAEVVAEAEVKVDIPVEAAEMKEEEVQQAVVAVLEEEEEEQVEEIPVSAEAAEDIAAAVEEVIEEAIEDAGQAAESTQEVTPQAEETAAPIVEEVEEIAEPVEEASVVEEPATPEPEPEPVVEAEPEEVPQQQPKQPTPDVAKPVEALHEVVDAPELAEGGSTIRWRAKVLPEGCANAVARYLRHTRDDRAGSAKAVLDARGAVNDARVHMPAKVATTEAALAKATAALEKFDIESVETFGGDLPKTCIMQVEDYIQTLPVPTSQSNFILCYTHFYRLMLAHSRLLGLLASGEIEYLKGSYQPMLAHFGKFTDGYYAKANEQFSAAHPKPGLLDKLTGKQKEVPRKEFILHTAKGLGYACVPLVLTGVIVILAVAFAPVLLMAVIVNDLVYQVYIKLFLFYYTYGMHFPKELTAAVTRTFGNALAGDWNAVADTALDALFDLAGIPDGFYNGILLMFCVTLVCVTLAIMVFCWLYCCCYGRGGRGGSKRSAISSNNKKSKVGNPEKSSSKAPDAKAAKAAPATKKKN